MANYSQYTSLPNWGTSQFQFLTPPVPSYQPQPSWGGLDFYRAHAGNVFDSALYDQIWARAQPLTGATAGGTGIGLAEAQYWHRRIYGGLTDMRTALPPDIGAAAAYEAYRTFQTHTSIYAQPLLGDPDPHGRMREALVGMAVAEVSRLWQFAGRVADRMGMMQASEVAAFTVSRIWYEAGAGGAGMGAGMGGMGGMGVGMGAGMNAGMGSGMGSGMGGGLGGGLGAGQVSPVSFGGGAGGLSPLRSPAISPGITIPGMHSPRFAPSDMLGLPQPPPFSRRRSRSVGALGAPGVGYGAPGAGYGAGAGVGLEAVAAIQRALTPTMQPGAGMPMGGGAYPYASSGGAYPYAAGGGQGVGAYPQSYTTDPYAYTSSSSSHRPRSRHRHHHRHRSHSRSRRNPLEDPLAYGATYGGLGGQLPVGGQGGMPGNAAGGYGGGYGGGQGGYGGQGSGGYGGGYPYAGSGYRY